MGLKSRCYWFFGRILFMANSHQPVKWKFAIIISHLYDGMTDEWTWNQQ